MIFESCVDCLEDALAAEAAGAHRIELCSALDQDGLTPSLDLAAQCVARLSLPVMVMVRCRGGDFVYSAAEVERMEADILNFKRTGVAGVVFGSLTADRQVDVANTCRLVQAALPLDVTFHKAIDCAADVALAFETLNSIKGITRVLSSGGRETAWSGRDTLRAMQQLPGRQIQIIAAGKITRENRSEITRYTGIDELHGKRIV